MSVVKTQDYELTGHHVLIILLAFFGILIAVNVYFGYKAVQTFTGEDVKKSYLQGINYNQTLAARESQAALGWTARANVTNASDGMQQIWVALDDRAEVGVSSAALSGVLAHRVDSRFDVPLTFAPQGDGQYMAEFTAPPGPYRLKAEAQRGGDQMRFTYDFIVRP